MASPGYAFNTTTELRPRLEWHAVGVWLAILLAIVAVPLFVGVADIGDYLIRNSIRLSLAYWAVAAGLMLCGASADVNHRHFPLARMCWTLAWIAFLLHSLAAWHYFHGWSQSHAEEHTRQVSGAGWGVYVTYFFTLVWTLDVVQWWRRPGRYAVRPFWMNALLHGFLTFTIFCGTVVYESGPMRWIGTVGFLILASLALSRIAAITQTSRTPTAAR